MIYILVFSLLQQLQFALKIFNYFFTSVFILEAVMKIIALGVVRYFKDRYGEEGFCLGLSFPKNCFSTGINYCLGVLKLAFSKQDIILPR